MYFQKVFLVFMMFYFPAQAASLELESTQGSQFKTYGLSGSGDFNKPSGENDNTYDWNLALDRSKTDLKAATGETITDNTTDFSAGMGLEFPTHFRMGAALSYSITPEENLKNSGPSLSLGYTYNFRDKPEIKKTTKSVNATGDASDSKESQEADSAEDFFSPYLAVDLNFQSLDYVQTFEAKVQRRQGGPGIPLSGKNTINQKSSQLTIKYKPFQWVRLKASYTKYSYSRSVSDFIQFLDTHDLIGNASSGISSALSGFYDNTVAVGASFYPSSSWEVALSRSTSKLISDDSLSTTDKLIVYWDFAEAWRLGVGGYISKSNTAGSEASTSTIISLGYEF